MPWGFRCDILTKTDFPPRSVEPREPNALVQGPPFGVLGSLSSACFLQLVKTDGDLPRWFRKMP
jgi:hypothetical protein